MDCSMPGIPVLHYLPEFSQIMSIELVMPSKYTILCCLLLLSSILPSIRVFPERLLFSSVAKVRESSFSFSTSNEDSRLISFRMDWFDLIVVQGTLKSLLQHRDSKASFLQCSAFFMTQLSVPYMTTREIIALTIHKFVYKMMSLLSNRLSRVVINFLSRRVCLIFMTVVTSHQNLQGFWSPRN